MSSKTLDLPFALAETIWHAGFESNESYVTCPECLGTKAVTLILANDESYSLDCACCGTGFDGPRGVVKAGSHGRDPIPFTPHRVRVDGDEVMYSESGPDANCYQSADAKDLFATVEECQARCEVLNAERRAHDEKQALNHRMSKRRDLAWSVHYWRSERARLVKDLERIEARLHVCVEREAAVKKDGSRVPKEALTHA